MSRLPPVTADAAVAPHGHARPEDNALPQKLSTAVREDNPPVPIRHMDFGFEKQPLRRYFYDDNAFASAFYMAFSSVIPQGERFFIHSVRHYREQIGDAELEARVTGFIGQEAMHGKEHDAVNEAYEKMGFPLGRIDRSVRDGLRLLAKRLSKPTQLAFTVALEHYTAIISEFMLTHPEVRAKFDPAVGNFIFWHMMEETEHKAVAFDVYEKCVGSYALRVGTMIPTTVVLIAALANLQLYLLKTDQKRPMGGRWRDTLRGFSAIYGPRGLFGSVAPKLLDYFRPGFHPNDHDTRALLEEFREKFFGEQGELNEQLKKTVIPQVRSAA
ncbi:MAG: metal-dependent hydrolase [Moraxellaceae bacterium]|jgi:predicted metal-dependent hydrolase|nr:metal-dependent hydrolase [Moraxellaceae bacterium]